MELILMILVPFPLGFFLKNRLVAFVAYIAVHSFVFVFQTAQLLIEWAGGSESAFGAPFPEFERAEVWAYGVVNLVIYAVGLGLVVLGSRLGSRRRASRSGAVSLDPALGH